MTAPSRSPFPHLGVLLAVLACSLAFAEEEPEVHPTFQDFQATGQYVLYVKGKAVEDAEVFHSETAYAYLILAPSYEYGILILPRTGCVEKVKKEEVRKREDEGLDVVKAAQPCALGKFTLEGSDVVFKIGDDEVRLRLKPWLDGGARREQVIKHTPEYGRAAKAYRPDPATIELIKNANTEARIQIFFGTWCTFCNRFIPHALKVEQELSGTKLSFEYFGLPPPPAAWVCETATKMGITKLPTGIIFIGDKEVGRVIGTDWIRPEQSLVKHLR